MASNLKRKDEIHGKKERKEDIRKRRHEESLKLNQLKEF